MFTGILSFISHLGILVHLVTPLLLKSSDAMLPCVFIGLQKDTFLRLPVFQFNYVIFVLFLSNSVHCFGMWLDLQWMEWVKTSSEEGATWFIAGSGWAGHSIAIIAHFSTVIEICVEVKIIPEKFVYRTLIEWDTHFDGENF